jgi:hypothetical protein
MTHEHMAWIREQLEHGDGGELAPRLDGRRPRAHAAHSSATLAASTFAPFLGREHDLTIAGLSGFAGLRLEAKHHPLPVPGPPGSAADDDRRPANLDAELTGRGIVVGVESKLTEHLAAAEHGGWRGEYRRAGVLDPLPEPWRDAIRRRARGGTSQRFLNATQLLKHGLALCRSADDGSFGPDPVDLHLVYLYWEPDNGHEIEAVLEHREEVAAFAAEVGGPGLAFRACSHQQLWDEWRTGSGSPRWLVDHARALEERYRIAVADPDPVRSTARPRTASVVR